MQEESITLKKFSDFSLLEIELVQALKTLGYQNPTKVQTQSLICSLEKKQDMLCLSQTGSGKTLSFVLPVINHLIKAFNKKESANVQKNKHQGSVLILAPTRQLCLQITNYFDRFQNDAGIGGWGTIALYGGTDAMKQVLQLSKKPAVIVGTPGRVLNHLQNTKGFNLNNLTYLIMDQADRLLNMDFQKQINNILSLIPKQRTTYLYSATLTNKVQKLQRVSLKNPIMIKVSQKYQTVAKLDEYYIFIPSKWKDTYLIYILLKEKSQKTIIFAKTCLGAQRLCLMLKELQFEAECVHGQLSQTKRIQNLQKFKTNKTKILVCTDVISRGIDIQKVRLVINYDLCIPKDYIHRVGRTARIGLTGTAISIVTQYDVQTFLNIENKLQKKIPEYQTVQKDALVFLDRLQLCHQQVSRKMKGKKFY